MSGHRSCDGSTSCKYWRRRISRAGCTRLPTWESLIVDSVQLVFLRVVDCREGDGGGDSKMLVPLVSEHSWALGGVLAT